MKKQLLFLLLMSVFYTGYTQVQIGSNTNNPTANFPFRLNQYYSYSQSIYLASEINAPAGTITSIKWYYDGTSALPNSQNLDIYIGTTTKSSFANDFDWEPVANLKKVYTGGIVTGSVAGWVTLNLTEPFQYDGTSNLVVAIDENMAGRDNSGGGFFYTTEVTGLRSIGYYGNTPAVNIDPLNPPITGSSKASGNVIPNIIFGGITQSCTTPVNIAFSNITDAKATVSWNDTATHTEGSQYYLSTTNTPPTASTAATGSATTIKSIEIIDLDPITTYYVWVRNECSSGTYSAWSEFTSFFSGCATYDVFNENFDTTATNNMPFCWSKIIKSTENIGNAQVRAINSNAYSMPNALLLGNGSATGTYDVIAVSPEMTTLKQGTYRLKFYAKYAGANITSGSLEIGTLDNNTNSGLFAPISGATVNLSNTYVEYVVPLNYTGNDMYVGIRHASVTPGTLIYIDDIRYELAPNCPDVSQVAITNLGSSDVTVTWKEAGVEGKWDIVVGDDTVTDPNTLLDFDTTNDVNHIFTKSGLNASTKYKVWVRSHCPNGDKGAWIGNVAFTTLCESEEIITENFDTTTPTSLPACWSKLLRGTATGAVVETSAASSFSAPNSARLFNENSSGNTYDVILVSPPLSNIGDGKHRLRFTVRGIADPQLQIGTLNTNLVTATFTPLALQDPINITPSQVEYIVDFDSYSGGTDAFIGFKLVSPNNYKTIFIDNISWEEKPTCADVKNVVVSGVSTTTAGLTWEVKGTEHLWDVAVGLLSSETKPDDLPIVTSDYDVNAVEVTELEPATAYKAWARAHCENGNGAWIGPVTFSTDCNTVAGFDDNFNSYTSSDLPPCWNKIIRNADPISFIAVEFKGITMYAATSNSAADVILVCPKVSTLNDASYILKLDVEASNVIEVGTVNSVLSNAVFTKITEFMPKGKEVSLSLPYSGTDQFIALRMKTVDPASSQYAAINSASWTTTLGNNEFSLSGMTYYPNPVKDVLNISHVAAITSVSIYNMVGQEVISNKVNASNAVIDLSMLSAGTYFARVAADNQIKTIKIIKD